ncbi:MAG: porin [Myxococcales bacterium]|nr:porin [Myxococcales bacterium]
MLLGVLLLSGRALADGFQLDRYQPTPAGEWSFWVDHPWYSSTRHFAGGLTFDYGHNPLVVGKHDGEDFSRSGVVVAHQLSGHLDLAASMFNRVTLSGSLPLVLLERGGTPAAGAAALSGVALGDPRIGFMIRIYGEPDQDAFSISFGGHVWIPIGSDVKHAGDSGVRVLPKLVLGGFKSRVRWSFTGGYLVRNTASIGTIAAGAGNTVGSEFQLGAAIGYGNPDRTFHIGPEAVFATVTSEGHAFNRDYTTLELLIGGHYLIGNAVQLGAGVGMGVLREPGTPDFRALFRIAYAPIRHDKPPVDSDGDGILDPEDACPQVKGVRTDDPKTNGCPPAPGDRDGDGVLDPVDLCPDEAKADYPDPEKLGCPLRDRDRDGVPDRDDLCPDVSKGETPDPGRLGCPAGDRDGDKVLDHEDMCPDVHSGPRPDPAKRGCPLADRDGDTVPDVTDACPDVPGAPDPSPAKNGCPGLVTVKNGMIVILQPVFFATDKDVILPKSFPLLQAVANALIVQPEIKRLAIEGHTDDRGKPAHNLDLSERRAKSVRRWLIEHGIIPDGLEAHGYGQTRPIMPNASAPGRAVNRRVEFRIVDVGAAKPAD